MPIPRKPAVPARPEVPDDLRGERMICNYCQAPAVWIACTWCRGTGGGDYECTRCFGYTGWYACRCYPGPTIIVNPVVLLGEGTDDH